MSQLISEIFQESRKNVSMEIDNQENIMRQIKSYAFYLTMQLADSEIGNYLLDALKDCKNIELFQILGGCVAGWLNKKLPVRIKTAYYEALHRLVR